MEFQLASFAFHVIPFLGHSHECTECLSVHLSLSAHHDHEARYHG